MTHDLKIDEQYFISILEGIKTFEIRYNDRNFQVGDRIILKEITNDKEFTGRQASGIITYITDYEQKDGYVVFSFIMN